MLHSLCCACPLATNVDRVTIPTCIKKQGYTSVNNVKIKKSLIGTGKAIENKLVKIGNTYLAGVKLQVNFYLSQSKTAKYQFHPHNLLKPGTVLLQKALHISNLD